MAEEVQFPSRPDNKRKFDDQSDTPPPPSSVTRRPTGFSAPVVSSEGAPLQPDGIELAKQRAQEIAAKLFSDAEAKRPKTDNGTGTDLSTDYTHKSFGQLPSFAATTPTTSFNPYGGYMGSSRRIDIPNGRVGVIIGKGGETIKYLQQQSGGCKIQITRDSDADPNSQTRTVELSGTSEQISKAEKLISDVLAEAESGGSGIVAARKFVGVQVGGEQFSMKVPNNKVGIIIGKGGETIKNLQASSGARIQIIPLHPPPGYTSTERTVQIDGTMEQIESAKQLINEVISENRGRNPQYGGGYSQQGYRPPRPPTGPPGAPMQQPGYGYMQPPQYNMPQPPYGSYPPQPVSGGYDYYNQQQPQPPQQTLGVSPAPADNNSYNYGQAPVYNSQASYPQTAGGQQQAYGQDAYSGSYNAQAPQPVVSQPASNPPAGYDQGHGSAHGYTGTAANPVHDGSSASTYGPPAGVALTQQGYVGQPPSYGQSPQAQKPPVYAQTGAAPQATYGQPPPAQSGYSQPPYGQQVPAYGGAPLPSQAGYGQQPQQLYADAYGGGGYAQPPAYSGEGGQVTKSSPQA